LKSPHEMAELFSDIPEAVENSIEIAKRCNLELTLGQNFLPDFPVPVGMSLPGYFRIQAEQGLESRLEHLMAPSLFDPGVLSEERCRPYRQRLAQEIDVITAMGFAGYFLIVADYIQWAKANGVPVGPGRGSGAGSLAAYALGITELDPLRYELLFERFLNPERVSLPDFDVDFCMEGRDRVIDYVAERYGRDRVSQIITYGSMAAKAVVRDVGRVLGYPYGFVDKIAKLIPFDLKMTLDKALEQEEELRRRYQQEDEVRALIDLAKALEGLTRNAGKHAGGVVIAPAPLTEFLPLYCEQGGANLVSQLDMEDVADLGLVKFDFLGLRTLTIIDWAVKIINADRTASGEPLLDITALPMDDAPTFELLKRCATTAVFQLESRGMKDLIRRLQPDCFEDVVALVALFRPGPLQSGMVDDFINRKHGRAKVDYPHPLLEPILKPSYGVILYQEQVMQIAQVLAGYTLGGADLLRRAMGKKKPEEMAKQRAVFVNGSVERGVEQATATYIFDLMEKFAGYGFNRCIHGATRILNADNGYETTVAELFSQRRPFRIHALGEDGRLRIRRVTDVVWNGRKPVYELVTAQGKRIVATANHPFRTLNGWTLLEDLRSGDRIAAPRRLPVATKHSWPRHELIALAGLLSEGNTCHPSCLCFYGNDRTLVEDFAAAAAAFPNTVARIDERADGRLEVCVNTGRDTRFRPGNIPWNAGRRFDGNAAVAADVAPALPLDRSGAFLWTRRLGILGCKATEKFIPPEVYGLCDADLELFLGRLWAGDGFIANATQTIPYYATSSEMLAKGTQALLLRLGILSGLHSKQFKYRGGLRPGYTVYLIGEASVETFMARVAPHALGRERQVELLCRHLSSTRRGQTSKDTIPAEIRTWVDEERRKAGLTWSELEEQSGTCMREFFGSGSSGKRGFRRATIARVAKHLSSERLAQLAHADIFWDTVVSIEPKGIADTYDLTVE
ncbi:MAG: DNA polymerase III subunit alpha, partial [Bacteroidota bacterium]